MPFSKFPNPLYQRRRPYYYHLILLFLLHEVMCQKYTSTKEISDALKDVKTNYSKESSIRKNIQKVLQRLTNIYFSKYRNNRNYYWSLNKNGIGTALYLWENSDKYNLTPYKTELIKDLIDKHIDDPLLRQYEGISKYYYTPRFKDLYPRPSLTLSKKNEC